MLPFLEDDALDFLNHEPGLSVVLSTYNRPFMALGVIRQLMAQTDLDVPVEILVISDGGYDGSLQILKDFTSDGHWPIRFFDSMLSDTYGVALCRNIGIKFARYDRVVFLDDDLIIGKDFLSHYAAAPEGLCLGRIDSIAEQKGVFERLCDERGLILRGETRHIKSWKAYLGYLWGGNFCIPTRFAMAIGGMDVSFLGEGEEDTDFGARAMSFLSGFYVVPGAMAVHHGAVSNYRVVIGVDNEKRIARAEERFRQRGSFTVNGGLAYWKKDNWNQFTR